jgi:hypothetical protein
MKSTIITWVNSPQRMYRGIRSFIFSLTFLILFSTLAISLVVASPADFVEGQCSLYIIREIVEVTSDWTIVEWIQGPKVISVRHKVLEGADAPGFRCEVSGLSIIVSKSAFDSTEVVIEIEALALMGDNSASLNISKGNIAYTKVQFYGYNRNADDFVKLGQFLNDGITPRIFELPLSSLYAMPSNMANIQKAVEELDKKVFAFYYPWYAVSEGPSGIPFHWEEGITDFPMMGLYDSADEKVILAHMTMAEYAGIDGFISSWWGAGSFEDNQLPRILDVAERVDFQISIYYESVRELTKQSIIDELTYVVDTYGDHPCFLKDSGRPVLFIYAVSYENRDSSFWLDVRRGLEANVGPVVLIGDTFNPKYLQVFEGFHNYVHLDEDPEEFYKGASESLKIGLNASDLNEVFSSAYDGEEIIVDLKSFFLTVIPGNDIIGKPELKLDRQDGNLYWNFWEVAIGLDVDSVLITSWNEWHEGTEIEPSMEYGFDYLKMTRQFVEEYKQITLPTPQTNYSARANFFALYSNNRGGGHLILSSATEVPGLFLQVQIEAISGCSEFDLKGDFYYYLEEQNENMVSIMIPCTPSLGELDVEVNFNVTIQEPLFYVNISAFDPLGKNQRLINTYIKVFDAGTWNNQSYYVNIISNATISDLSFNQTLKQLSFSINEASGTTGLCNITVPDELMAGDFSLYMDDIELVEGLDYSKTHNGNHYLFSVNYEHSNHVIELFSTIVIPDFAGWLFLPFLMFMTFSAIMLRRSKKAP